VLSVHCLRGRSVAHLPGFVLSRKLNSDLAKRLENALSVKAFESAVKRANPDRVIFGR
jgi:hypothetical protein